MYVISRNAQYKEVNNRTIEIPQRTLIFYVHYCLNVPNVCLEFLDKAPVSGIYYSLGNYVIMILHSLG